jgi:ADP-ribose pyrophosphatase
MTYRILAHHTVFQGRAFDVQQVEMELPDGRSRTYDLVQHASAVTILPLTDDGFIYFVSQYRLGSQSELLELPAGVLEEVEDPLEGAGRELQEEVGLAARELIKIGEFFMSPGYSTEKMYVYLARGLYPAPLDQDEDEFLSLSKISLVELWSLVRSGQLQDGKSLAALFLAQEYLELP